MSRSNNRLKQASSTPTYPAWEFPFQLHKFLNETAAAHPDAVHWEERGASFMIDATAKVVPGLMAKYFKHGNYDSFRRQLNCYGFSKTRTENGQSIWNRPGGLFHRDHPENLEQIRPRPRASGKRHSSRTSTREQPKRKKRRKSLTKGDAAVLLPKETTTLTAKDSQAAGPEGSLFFGNLLGAFIDESSAKHPDVVNWNEDGTAFFLEIHDPRLPNIIKPYFAHGQYSSLRRQLNAYGFKRDTNGHYCNPLFYRGNYGTIVRRERSGKSVSGGKKSKKAAAEPRAVPTGTRVSKRTHKPSIKAAEHFEPLDHGVPSDDDTLGDDSTLFDYDLSTYATLRTDEMSFERLESRFDETSFERLEDEDLDNHHEAMQETEDPKTLPKFQVLQRVYARDKDGLLYTAVIRRQLFGTQYHKQITMALEEAMDEPHEDDSEPLWHYFVHYNNWNVTFDHWVSEKDVFEISDEVKAYAERVYKEHRALQQEMRKVGVKGKKQWQTVDGAIFLLEWGKRLRTINKEMKQGGMTDETEAMEVDGGEGSTPKQPVVEAPPRKRTAWNKVSLLVERDLRAKGLTKKRPSTHATNVMLPFSLKKVLVEQWELINQCNMIPALPAKVTVRDALNQYLEYKHVVLPVKTTDSEAAPTSSKGAKDVAVDSKPAAQTTKPSESTEGQGAVAMKEPKLPPAKTDAASTEASTAQVVVPEKASLVAAADTKEIADAIMTDGAKSSEEKEDSLSKPQAAGATKPDGAPHKPVAKAGLGDSSTEKPTEGDKAPVPTAPSNTPKTPTGPSKAPMDTAVTNPASAQKEISKRDQEWIDMADGICMLFDEALHSQLLYKEELPQLRVLDNLPCFTTTPYSEIYGCEHLLRLFVRLPDILAGALSDDEARPLTAKVNDFVRFLHKNEGALLRLKHRKLNEAELKEQDKIVKTEERKRIRLGASSVALATETAPATEMASV